MGFAKLAHAASETRGWAYIKPAAQPRGRAGRRPIALRARAARLPWLASIAAAPLFKTLRLRLKLRKLFVKSLTKNFYLSPPLLRQAMGSQTPHLGQPPVAPGVVGHQANLGRLQRGHAVGVQAPGSRCRQPWAVTGATPPRSSGSKGSWVRAPSRAKDSPQHLAAVVPRPRRSTPGAPAAPPPGWKGRAPWRWRSPTGAPCPG